MASATTRPEFHEWRPHPWHGLEADLDRPAMRNDRNGVAVLDLDDLAGEVRDRNTRDYQTH